MRKVFARGPGSRSVVDARRLRVAGSCGSSAIVGAIGAPRGRLSVLTAGRHLGGSATEISNNIAVDKDGDLYVTGRTGSANFPVTPGAFDTTLGGDRDGFVTKLDLGGRR
jgi:hypothetical protein